MLKPIDNCIKKTMRRIYADIEKNGGELSISSPEYKQTEVDELVSKGLVAKIDISALDGWAYILKPTYHGESVIAEEKTIRNKIDELLKRGAEIGNEESHVSGGPYHIFSVSGPMYDQWMNEINIFNERYLMNHPLHDSIYTTYIHRKNRSSTFNDMMGYLKALLADEDLVGASIENNKGEGNMVNKTIAHMISEDIDRCKVYLENPLDDSVGIDIYVDITGKYDSVIPNFGDGLYQFYKEQHFYDPEISGESLIHNLKKLMNKMKAFLAMEYPEYEKKTEGPTISIKGKNEGPECKSNRIFIVHGHNNEAKQEMARTLEKAGFEAVVLHEQPDAGLTIIEKIEKYTDVAFAVVLYTECDLGRPKGLSVDSEKYRARQNVVFEHGYLMCKLGRSKVCALVKGDVETPGDISGVVYIKMDSAGAWKIQLANNLKAAGLEVDLNKFCI